MSTSPKRPTAKVPSKTLAEEAAALVPRGDPSFVGETALPAMKARQDRLKQRMLARGDRLGTLIGEGLFSEFRDNQLVTRNLLTADQITELKSLAPEAEAAVMAELGQAFSELRSILAPLDPLTTTAQISFNHTVGPAGSYHEPTSEKSEVAVEIVASLFASQPAGIDPKQADPGTIQAIEDLLSSIRDLQSLVLVLQAWQDEDPQAGYLRMVGRVRLAAVRGESYASHGQEVAAAVLRPLDGQLRREFGFSMDEFLAVATAAHDLTIERVNEQTHRLADVFSRAHSALAETASDEQIGTLGAEIASAFEGLPGAMIFTAAEVASHGGIDPSVAATILERVSVCAGELDSGSYRSPLDPCPYWQRPFLRVGDQYVLPIAGHALRSPLAVFEQRLLTTSSSFSKHRADVVDGLALRYLTEALPGSEAFGPGAYYRFDDGDGTQRYETDGVVVFEGWVLIVEGKANSLSHQAHRGDLTRLGRDISNSLKEAWEQCARVQRYLHSAQSITFENKRGDQSFTVAAPDPDKVLFVNPMLHSLGTFAFELPRLASLVTFTSDGVPWPVLITDLRVITELSGPAGLLHYLRWRSKLPLGEGLHTVDELDIFGSYLFGGMGGPEPGPGSHVSMASSTVSFDEYYMADDRGASADPPRRVLGDWLESVVAGLAESRRYRWLDQSFTILDLTLHEAAWLTAFAESLAPRNIRSRRWYSNKLDDLVAVALAADVEWSEVLLDLNPTLSQGTRWLAVRLSRDGPEFLSCDRRR